MLPSTVKKKVKKMVSAGVILVRKKQWYQKSFLIAVAALLLLWEGWIYIGPFFPRNFTADYFLHEQFNSTKYVLDLATLVASSQAVTNLRFEQALNSTEFLMGRLTVLEDTTRTLVTQSRFSELANATDLLLQRLKLLEDQFPQAATASQFNQVLNATNLLLQRLEVLEKRCAEVMSTQLDQIRKAANLLLERMKIAEDAGISLQKKLEQQKDSISNTAEKVDQLSRNLEFSIRQSQEVKFLPLNDLERFKVNAEKHGIHGFISEIWGRGDAVGPPEFLYFPSNISHDRLLCIKGNHTKNGTENFYGFAFRESLPSGSVFEPGTTLISNTYWDFTNPWHSMFNLVQFIYWNMHHGCRGANRLLLYHLGELRDSMGSWISNLLLSNHLPWRSDTQIFSGPPVCFEQAVVSRIGIGGVPYFTLQELFKEARCQARRMCNVPFSRTGPSTKKISHVTLMVRERARGYADLSSWEDVVRKSCEKVEGCSWSVMHIANLTFCQQVAEMSRTDILISAHGAQLTNSIFMNPRSRIMEMFPKGWLELAGGGQYIYRNLAEWVGLQHEGYWRDPYTPDCPKPNDPVQCFSFYKDQKLGINATRIGEWLDQVIQDFNQKQEELLADGGQDKSKIPWDSPTCTCTAS